jgi:hypothetical protein
MAKAQNTMESTPDISDKAPSKKELPGKGQRLLGRLMLYAGLAIIVLVMIWLVVKAYRMYTAYQATNAHLTALQALMTEDGTSLTEIDLARVEEELRGTAAGFEDLHQEARPFLPLTCYLGWLPGYGADIQAVPYLLEAGRDGSRAGLILWEQFRPLLEWDDGGAQTDRLSQAVTRLAEGQPSLERAGQLLKQAQDNINQLNGERLSPKVASRLAPLEEYLPLAITGLETAQRLPSMLGVESPQAYLILTQNSDELRPTGGYINAAGHVVLDQGRITEFVMQDSYAVDEFSEAYPYPPDPIREYMAADYWILRDANWSPDFPTSARTAIELYELGQGISAEGVVALDQQAISYLLRAFEPIEVDGEQVTGQNVITLMRQHWAPEQDQELVEWWRGRKSFMMGVAQAVRQKAEQDPEAINFSQLLEALQQALGEKHILVYLADPYLAELVEARNWSGALHPGEGDYLMVVDANLGFNKASALVERRLAYQVTLEGDGGAQVHASLMYRHGGQKRAEACRQEPRYDPVYEGNMERCYWNYLRLVVPAEAQLLTGPKNVVDGQYLLRGRPTTGEIDIAPLSENKASWGQLFLLPPGETLELDYFYTLPPGTARRSEEGWVYDLYLQKQPGTLEPAVDVVVTLPQGMQLVKSTPEPHSHTDQAIKYSINMRTDQRIQLVYR